MTTPSNVVQFRGRQQQSTPARPTQRCRPNGSQPAIQQFREATLVPRYLQSLNALGRSYGLKCSAKIGAPACTPDSAEQLILEWRGTPEQIRGLPGVHRRWGFPTNGHKRMVTRWLAHGGSVTIKGYVCSATDGEWSYYITCGEPPVSIDTKGAVQVVTSASEIRYCGESGAVTDHLRRIGWAEPRYGYGCSKAWNSGQRCWEPVRYCAFEPQPDGSVVLHLETSEALARREEEHEKEVALEQAQKTAEEEKREWHKYSSREEYRTSLNDWLLGPFSPAQLVSSFLSKRCRFAIGPCDEARLRDLARRFAEDVRAAIDQAEIRDLQTPMLRLVQ